MADTKANETVSTEPKTDAKPAEAPATPTVEDLSKQLGELKKQNDALVAAMEKQKKAIDNASADAADWKRKYRSTLDDAARAEAERKEADEAKDKRIAELERKDIISTYSNRALSLGYDAELAKATAEAMANHDMNAVFDGIGVLLETVKTRVITENLGKQPSLTPGNTLNQKDIVSAEIARIRKAAGLE